MNDRTVCLLALVTEVLVLLFIACVNTLLLLGGAINGAQFAFRCGLVIVAPALGATLGYFRSGRRWQSAIKASWIGAAFVITTMISQTARRPSAPPQESTPAPAPTPAPTQAPANEPGKITALSVVPSFPGTERCTCL